MIKKYREKTDLLFGWRIWRESRFSDCKRTLAFLLSAGFFRCESETFTFGHWSSISQLVGYYHFQDCRCLDTCVYTHNEIVSFREIEKIMLFLCSLKKTLPRYVCYTRACLNIYSLITSPHDFYIVIWSSSHRNTSFWFRFWIQMLALKRTAARSHFRVLICKTGREKETEEKVRRGRICLAAPYAICWFIQLLEFKSQKRKIEDEIE